jgi:hypothetical protein
MSDHVAAARSRLDIATAALGIAVQADVSAKQAVVVAKQQVDAALVARTAATAAVVHLQALPGPQQQQTHKQQVAAALSRLKVAKDRVTAGEERLRTAGNAATAATDEVQRIRNQARLLPANSSATRQLRHTWPLGLVAPASNRNILSSNRNNSNAVNDVAEAINALLHSQVKAGPEQLRPLLDALHAARDQVRIDNPGTRSFEVLLERLAKAIDCTIVVFSCGPRPLRVVNSGGAHVVPLLHVHDPTWPVPQKGNMFHVLLPAAAFHWHKVCLFSCLLNSF